ncbi:MAG: family 10 glycosylhydrolase [Acidobacteriota bacterium]
MRKLLSLLLFGFMLYNGTASAAEELRGAWLSRNEVVTRAKIAEVMDSLANNNFNVAYVNCWSRGYTLFPSETMKKHTGVEIDPAYVGRDVLAEAIAEGHRRGIEVEAWFEYGFVGGYTGYYPGSGGRGKIFDAHPDWVAKKVDGTEKDNSNFYWMVATRPDVRQFMVDLHVEVARKYDIDGIELDRIRYAGNVYGYDAYTDSVYMARYGVHPPTDVADAQWMRFRADILNGFMRTVYDSIKAVNPNVFVTNAPGFYSSSSYQSYNDNLQDWWQWLAAGSVDHVQVQMYVGSNSSLKSYLNYLFANVPQKEKMIPAIATSPNGNAIAESELMNMVTTTRSLGLKGNAWWYYGDMAPYWNFYRTQAYPTPAAVPGRSYTWRTPAVIVNETDSALVTYTGKWLTAPASVPGYKGTSLYADSIGVNAIEYRAAVPAGGWYEVYAYQATQAFRTMQAPFDLYDSSGAARRVLIDQTNDKLKGWYKLGDVYLKSGVRKVVRLSNDNIGGGRNGYVSADAVMLVLNRRLSPGARLTEVPHGNFTDPQPGKFWLGQNFPNPFNPSTTVSFALKSAAAVRLSVFDVLGRECAVLIDGMRPAGMQTVEWNAGAMPSGVYFCRLQVSAPGAGAAFAETKKLLLQK